LIQGEFKAQGAAWPTSMMELDVSERLIVWAFRLWVQGLRRNDGTQWALVVKEFGRLFKGSDGTAALAGFARLIDGLRHSARRTVRLHQACCPCLTADEVSLVCFVAACQRPAASLARVRAESLVRAEGVGDMLQAGSRLAGFMRRHGLLLPQRTQSDIAGQGTAEISITLH